MKKLVEDTEVSSELLNLKFLPGAIARSGMEGKVLSQCSRHSNVSCSFESASGETGPPLARQARSVAPERSEERLHEGSEVIRSMTKDLGGL